jgi:hypothetical protein
VDAIKVYERELHEERARKLDSIAGADQRTVASDVDITKVEVLTNKGQPLNGLQSADPVEIRIHYRTYGAPRKADAVLRIVRSDGVTCCMLRTFTDQTPLTLASGEGKVAVILDPLQLIGGTYFVNAYLSTERDLVLLATGRSDWFYVAGNSLSNEERSGVFEPNRRWISCSQPYPEQVMA